MPSGIRQAERATPDRVVTADGVALHRQRLLPDDAARTLRNPADDFLLALPLRRARIRVETENGVVFDGEAHPGTVRFVQPMEQARVTVRTEVDQLVLGVPGPLFRQTARGLGMGPGDGTRLSISPVLTHNDSIRRMLPLLDPAMRMRHGQREAVVSGLAATVMALLCDPALHRTESGEDGFDARLFEALQAYADGRIAAGIHMVGWAAVADQSVDAFSRRFQRHTGLSPYAWFLDRRIARAMTLLVDTEASLVEVALETGFSSQSHFTEAFRRRTGSPPGRWRRQRRSGVS